MTSPKFGVSFSLKQCKNFELEWQKVLHDLLHDLGVRRFRLMSYWDEHEPEPGKYDFSDLDKQIDIIEAAGGEITLCLGARQPRWPENHWPNWAWHADYKVRSKALLQFIETVVVRYRNRDCIVSYQLENEALLKTFGKRSEVNVNRLKQEFFVIKSLDTSRPIIMTTSTSWGIPIKQPIPDIVGFSYYQRLYSNGKYRRSFHRPWLDRWRSHAITVLHQKPSFIHELQAEPWGPKNIWEMSPEEQDKSMSLTQLKASITQAKAIGLYPIDLWGAEWWYWLKEKKKSPQVWNQMKVLFK